MICPECKSEYRVGFIHCTDCDIDLVDHLPPDPGPDSRESSHDEPVIVFVTTDSNEAALVASILNGSGIEVQIFDNNSGRMDSPLSQGISGAKIAVPRHQEKLAREVLLEYRSPSEQNPSGGDTTTFPFSDSDETTGTDDASENVPYRCIHCHALLEPETTVCSQCGGTPYKELS